MTVCVGYFFDGKIPCDFPTEPGQRFCSIHIPQQQKMQQPPPLPDYQAAWASLMGHLRNLALVAIVDGGATPEQRVAARVLAAVTEIAKAYDVEGPT